MPPGYRPAKREVHAVLAGGSLGRVNIDGPAFANQPAGSVSIDGPTTYTETTNGYLSLDGITFRCAPAGQDGCP